VLSRPKFSENDNLVTMDIVNNKALFGFETATV